MFSWHKPLCKCFFPCAHGSPVVPLPRAKCPCVTALLCVGLSVCLPPSQTPKSTPNPSGSAAARCQLLWRARSWTRSPGTCWQPPPPSCGTARRSPPARHPCPPRTVQSGRRRSRVRARTGLRQGQRLLGSPVAAIPWGTQCPELPKPPLQGLGESPLPLAAETRVALVQLSAVVCCDACPHPAPAPRDMCRPPLSGCPQAAPLVLERCCVVWVLSLHLLGLQGWAGCLQGKPHPELSLLCFGSGRKHTAASEVPRMGLCPPGLVCPPPHCLLPCCCPAWWLCLSDPSSCPVPALPSPACCCVWGSKLQEQQPASTLSPPSPPLQCLPPN